MGVTRKQGSSWLSEQLLPEVSIGLKGMRGRNEC